MLSDQERRFCHKLALTRNHRAAAAEAGLSTNDTYLAELLSRDDIATAMQMSRGYVSGEFERPSVLDDPKNEGELIGDLVKKITEMIGKLESGELHPAVGSALKGFFELQAKLQGLLKDKMEITRNVKPGDMTDAELLAFAQRKIRVGTDQVRLLTAAVDVEYKEVGVGAVKEPGSK